MNSEKPVSVSAYIKSFPKDTQVLLLQMQSIIQKTAPKAEEIISYAMPAYKLHGMLVFFAGYKNHIGFYPSGSSIVEFQHKLSDYKFSKGAIQFPLNKPLPIKLITDIVKFRVKENEEKEKVKLKNSSISKKK